MHYFDLNKLSELSNDGLPERIRLNRLLLLRLFLWLGRPEIHRAVVKGTREHLLTVAVLMLVGFRERSSDYRF